MDELIAKAKTGDKQALEQLYNENTGAIGYMIKKYKGMAEVDDLEQEAYIGFHSAVMAYDPRRGLWGDVLFAYLRATLFRFCNHKLVSMSVRDREKLAKYKKMIQDGHSPTDEELHSIGIDSHQALNKLTAAAETVDIMHPIGDDVALIDTLADGHDLEAEAVEQAYNDALRADVVATIDALPDKDSKLLYTLMDHDLSLKAAADAIGVDYLAARGQRDRLFTQLRKVSRLRRYAEDGAYRGSLGAWKRSGESVPERIAILMHEEDRARRAIVENC